MKFITRLTLLVTVIINAPSFAQVAPMTGGGCADADMISRYNNLVNSSYRMSSALGGQIIVAKQVTLSENSSTDLNFNVEPGYSYYIGIRIKSKDTRNGGALNASNVIYGEFLMSGGAVQFNKVKRSFANHQGFAEDLPAINTAQAVTAKVYGGKYFDLRDKDKPLEGLCVIIFIDKIKIDVAKVEKEKKAEEARVEREKVYIDKLSTYAWAATNQISSTRASKLVKSGWRNVYTEYNVISANNDNVLTFSMPYTKGKSYSFMGAVQGQNNDDSRIVLIDASIADSAKSILEEYHLGDKESALIEKYDMHFKKDINKLLFGFVPKMSGVNGSLMVFERDVDFKRDIEELMAEAKLNFVNIKNYKYTATAFNTTISLGGADHMLIELPASGLTYRQSFSTGTEEEQYMLENVIPVLKSKSGTGNFIYKEYRDAKGNQHSTLLDGENIAITIIKNKADRNTNVYVPSVATKEIVLIPKPKKRYRTIHDMSAEIRHIAFSKDDSKFVVASYDNTTGKAAGEITIFDAENETDILTIPDAPSDFALFTPDDKKIIAFTYGKGLLMYDAITGAILKTIYKDELKNATFTASISPNGKLLAAGKYFGDITIIDIEKGTILKTLKSNDANRITLQTHFLDDNTLVSAGGDVVKTWDITTGKELLKIIKPEAEINMVVGVSIKEKKVLCSYSVNSYIYDLVTGKQLYKYDLGNFYSGFLSPNADLVLLSAKEGVFALNGDLTCQENSGTRFSSKMGYMNSNSKQTLVVLGEGKKVTVGDFKSLVELAGKK